MAIYQMMIAEKAMVDLEEIGGMVAISRMLMIAEKGVFAVKLGFGVISQHLCAMVGVEVGVELLATMAV